MRTLWMALSAGVPLIGCYNQDKYAEDHAAALCALYEECEYLDQVQHADYEACAASTEESVSNEGCEDFDSKEAKECVSELNEMSCEDLQGQDFPGACERVCGG